MKKVQPGKSAKLDDNKSRTQAQTAIRVLREVFRAALEENRPADRVFSALTRANHQWGSRDRQWLSESVFAAFRWWGALRMLTGGKLPESDEEWARLIVGAWQLEDAANLPEAAESLIKLYHLPRPVIPAVVPMRERIFKILRGMGEHAKVEVPEVDERLLFPEWIFAYLPESIDFARLVEYCQRRPPMWLRSQFVPVAELIGELRRNNLNPEIHPTIPTAVKLNRARVNLYTLDAFRNGWFEVQDLASQYIGLVAAPKAGERWWDACAGAGGKSLQMAELMRRKGTVVASDLREWKLEDLKLRARRSGFPNIMTKPWDGNPVPKRQHESFDGVLVDAPCSCSGVWRRNPDGRWNLRAEEIEELAVLQLSILEKASVAVKIGGTLIYATCSIFERENRQVVEAFLAAHPEFELAPYAHPVTGAATPGYASVMPWEGDCDGMFAARFRRR